MEYFWSDSGHRPYFSYRIRVPKCTDEMYKWCLAYDNEGKHFRRFHVECKEIKDGADYDVVQFEWEEAALMFSLKFGVC